MVVVNLTSFVVGSGCLSVCGGRSPRSPQFLVVVAHFCADGLAAGPERNANTGHDLRLGVSRTQCKGGVSLALELEEKVRWRTADIAGLKALSILSVFRWVRDQAGNLFHAHEAQRRLP